MAREGVPRVDIYTTLGRARVVIYTTTRTPKLFKVVSRSVDTHLTELGSMKSRPYDSTAGLRPAI